MKIQIFDPPMCCSTGVCGPSVDTELVRFAADVDWLKSQGVDVGRFNLSEQPTAFATHATVKAALEKEGNECLPLIMVDGSVVCKGKYPSRETLASYAGIENQKSIFSEAVKELVAIGASIASNCEPCFKHHYNEARKLGVSKEDMHLAVEMAQSVKESPSRSILTLADKYLKDAPTKASPCCGGDESISKSGKCCG